MPLGLCFLPGASRGLSLPLVVSWPVCCSGSPSTYEPVVVAANDGLGRAIKVGLMRPLDKVRGWSTNLRRGRVMLDLLEEVAAERPEGATSDTIGDIHQEALRRGVERGILEVADDGSVLVRRR